MISLNLPQNLKLEILNHIRVTMACGESDKSAMMVFGEGPDHFAEFESLRSTFGDCDVIVKVGSLKIDAHKSKLASEFSFFKETFKKQALASPREGQKDIIEIRNLDENSVKRLLWFTYNGSLNLGDINNAKSTLDAAFYYGSDWLKRVCRIEMVKHRHRSV